MKKLLAILVLLTWIPAFGGMTMLGGMSAHANDAPNAPVTFLSAPEITTHQKTITRLENYLSNLTTLVSEFTQVAPDGSLSTGKFYLERPGRMRWQYNPPTPILIVSSGSELVYYDYELEQVTHIPLDDTLIGFLAQDKIHFDKDIGIVDFMDKAGVTRITLAQTEKPGDGALTLEFSDQPLQLRNMVVRDATGQVTTVSLSDAHFGIDLDKELFIFRDPRKPHER